MLLQRGSSPPGPQVQRRAARALHAAGGLQALAARGCRAGSPEQASVFTARQDKGKNKDSPTKRSLEQLLAVAIELAHRTLQDRLRHQDLLDSPAAVARLLSLRLAHQPREIFCVLFLDSHHRLLHLENLFLGTLAQTVVHPREVARRALECNAAGVILAHNHPSGLCTPSAADRQLTQSLKRTLACLEIPVLDHIIVSTGGHYSFAQAGLI
jgi:DNA repair protein RadC